MPHVKCFDCSVVKETATLGEAESFAKLHRSFNANHRAYGYQSDYVVPMDEEVAEQFRRARRIQRRRERLSTVNQEVFVI